LVYMEVYRMKIAISTDSGMVSEHFGRCPEYTILEIEDNKVIKRETIPNPGHRTGFIPRFLSENGVDCVMAGGAGFKAKQFFDEYGIKLMLGIQGKVDDVIERFINGKLKDGKSLCTPQSGRGYGLDKEDGHHGNN
jgi:predicted Fe-Mo cluster-binding NifX family protein